MNFWIDSKTLTDNFRLFYAPCGLTPCAIPPDRRGRTASMFTDSRMAVPNLSGGKPGDRQRVANCHFTQSCGHIVSSIFINNLTGKSALFFRIAKSVRARKPLPCQPTGQVAQSPHFCQDRSFTYMFRFETAGQSHGECLLATLKGHPGGIPIAIDPIQHELWRR